MGNGADFYFLVVMPVMMVATFAAMTVVPWAIGFTYLRRDADRRGQPGWLWALLTLPLGWLAILGYLIARSLDGRGTPAGWR